MRIWFLVTVMLMVLLMMGIIGCKENDGTSSDAEAATAGDGEAFRVLEWQGMIDFVGSDINFYVAEDGATEPIDRIRQAEVDEHGQARFSGYVPNPSTDQGTVYYYIDADENGACTPLWEPSGVNVFAKSEEGIVILWGVEGNDRDMECEGFQ